MSFIDDIASKFMKDKSGESSAQKKQSPMDQPAEDIELAGYVRSKVEEIRGHANRIASEGIWMTNIAYILGYDSVFYDPALRQFRPASKSPTFLKRNRIHANLILPGVQNRLARMLKSPPKWDVRPNSHTEEDKEAARLGVECIGMIWDKQQINRKRIDLGMWKQQCGHSYIKVSWDDSIGAPLPDLENETEPKDSPGYEGDVRIDVCSPLEVFPDPLAKCWDDLGYLIQAKVRRLDYFVEHYPENGHLVKEEGAWLLSAQYELRINSLNSAGTNSSGTAEQMKNAAIELSYYEKRSKRYPNGRHVIVANGVLLKNAELPCGEIPFAKFDDVIIGGKFYPESLVTHARPLQDHYNRLLVKRKDWFDRLLAGKYIAARGHGLSQEAMNDQSGEVVEYDPVPNAGEPHAMQFPSLPANAFTESNDIKSQMYEIMGLSEVARGQLPSASIPAQGMQILLEQDETRIGIETEQDEHSWARVGMLILKMIDKYYVTGRKLKGKGNGVDYKVKDFVGSDLKKNFDVTVIRGSTIPNMKVMQRQELLNAFQTGLLGNPQDPSVREKVWGALEYGDIGEMWEDQRLDMSQIKATIEQIEKGVQPNVNKADNHVLHVIEKNRYRKSEKFNLLSPYSQKLLLEDMDAHVQTMAYLANPQLLTPPQMPPRPIPNPMPPPQGAPAPGIAPNPVMPQNNMNGAPQ